MPSAKVIRAIRAFEKAVEARAFIQGGTEEDRTAAYSQRIMIAHNYVKARAKLERLLENV